MKTLRFSGVAVACLLALSGCLGGKKNVEPPAELVALAPELTVRTAWTAKVGSDTEFLRLGLRPASDGVRVYAASYNGRLSAFDLLTGRRDWSVDTDLRLSGGPGNGEDLVVVASAEGDVVAVEAVDGVRRWQARVDGEVLAPPVIARDVVVVRTVNGSLHGLSASTGDVLWRHEQEVPRLTLRGNGKPAVGANIVVTGFDDGRVIARDISAGTGVWQAPLGAQRGRTELERLSDIDTDIVVVGNEVYAAGYQSRIARLTLESGQPFWITDMSTVAGLGIDWTGVYATGPEGEVVALERETGLERWKQTALARRGVTGPTAFGNAVVVGDFEGYVHWLATDDGRFLARARAGKSAIITAPVAVGERLIVQTEGGSLHVFLVPAQQ